MKQQTRFYVSRKNPLTWIAAALSLASIVLQILALCLGEGAVISTVNIWFQKVLPMAVSLGFALQLVLEGGRGSIARRSPFSGPASTSDRRRSTCTCTAATPCSAICAMS